MMREFGPLRVALSYAVFGALWILLSDAITLRLISDGTSLPIVQTVKGLFYVAITTTLVYVLVRFSMRRSTEEKRRYQRLYEQDERQLGALLAVTRGGILEPLEGEDPLQALTETVAKTLNVKRVSMWRFNSDRTALECRDLFESPQARHTTGQSIATADYPNFCRALNEHRVVAADDALRDARTREFADLELRPHGITAVLDAPVLIRGKVDGVLCLQHAGGTRSWTHGEQTFAVSAANLISLLIVQENLRASEARFREMAENMQDIFYNYDPVRDRLLFAGQSYERIWGLPIEHVLANPMSFADSIHPDEREAVLTAHERGLAGEPTEMEFRVIRPDGSASWVVDCAFPIVNAEGVVDRIVGTIRDITDRKRAEEALAESRRQLSTLMDNLPGVAYRCRLDTDWTTLFLSEGITPLTGYRPADFLHNGRLTYAELIHPDDRERVYREIAAAAARGDTFEIEYRLHTREGTEKTVWERGRFFPGSAGAEGADEAGHVEGFILDITDRKQAEADRLRIEDQLRQAQKIDAIGKLAGGVAHDFNNMLTVILVRAELALKKLPPDDPARETFKEIHDAAERSAGLTRQLLTYARRQSVAAVPVRLNDAVEKILPMMDQLTGDGVAVEWKPGSDLWLVDIDPSQIDQILANLCLNARDAMESGGALILETRNILLTETDCRTLPNLKAGEHVLLSVRDTGIGMDSQTISRLFEPFFTTKEFGKGTGLGLPTVHGIVRQAQGIIDVHSEPGKGSTFTIYLPRSSGSPLPVSGVSPAPETLNGLPHGSGETILLAEAHPELGKLASEILETLGYRVLHVTNAEDVLRIAGDDGSPIDLLLVDADIPALNVSGLADNVLALRPRTGILFISGNPLHAPETAESWHSVRKPFATADLAIKLRAALDRSRHA